MSLVVNVSWIWWKMEKQWCVCLTSSNTLITCMFPWSFPSERTTEEMPQKYLSGSVKMRLCPPRILQRLCRDPRSNLNHSGIPATCECHQHQFTHGQGTLAMSTWYFLCILQLFPTGWLWNHSFRAGGRLFCFQISSLTLTGSKRKYTGYSTATSNYSVGITFLCERLWIPFGNNLK